MILTDTGPLVAIFDPGERHDHDRCTALLPDLRGPLITTLPCLTEAMYLLNETKGWYAQSQLWQLFRDKTLRVFDIDDMRMERMYSLMEKYSDVPMDFADASLVVAAENLKTNKIFTLDSDFSIYRLNGRTRFRNYSMSIKKVTQHPSQNESLIFERSQTGRVGYRLPRLDVEEMNIDAIIPEELRRTDDLDGVPEVSEVDVIRHFTRISTWNYSIDLGMYPLGSCTMKYNSRLNEKVARIAGFTNLHPLAPEEESQGALELIYELQNDLSEITGLPGVSLQPAAGAQGEMTGVMLIRAFLDQRDGEASKERRVMLIPDSAHGTNPASAALAGFSVKTIRSTAEGLTDMGHLKQLCDEGGVAGLMLTNPNTVGIFETNIKDICKTIHAAGGLVYMDGANMNALVGIARPGDMGVDVIHLNLHKTFSTPHGGGGPGCGPCLCSAELMPFLPVPRVVRQTVSLPGQADSRSYRLDFDYPKSIGRVKAFYGNFGMMIRALSYIYTHGADGLKEATEAAVLNARYVSNALSEDFDKPFAADPMHEVVFSHKKQSRKGVHTLDLAKRLIDYGFHPMTIYFPLVVEGAMLIEPTESVGRQDLDAFIEAMKDIDHEAQENPQLVIDAPHSTRIGRLDEAAAARKPVLRWKKDMETLSKSA